MIEMEEDHLGTKIWCEAKDCYYWRKGNICKRVGVTLVQTVKGVQPSCSCFDNLMKKQEE
jgi:hypothetical protein